MTIDRPLYYPPRNMNTLLHSLTYLVEPIGLIWLCLWIAVVRLWTRERRGVASFLALIALFMSIVGSTRVPGDLLASLERPFVIRDLEKLPVCDAAVVMGGGMRPSRYDVAGLDLNASGDRLIMALELIRLGKAKNLVIGGAAHTVNGRTRVEASMTKQWLATWGWDKVPVESLGACANTHDEAVRVADLCKEKGWQKILLVTSAYHMKRARGVFRTAGVPAICVPCDFQSDVSIETEPEWIFVPRYQGFEKLSIFIHENVGWLMYRWRGWIKT
jgi:uncharacterized SAM-binding protein YcdF (DUF218 family)